MHCTVATNHGCSSVQHDCPLQPNRMSRPTPERALPSQVGGAAEAAGAPPPPTGGAAPLAGTPTAPWGGGGEVVSGGCGG